MLHNIPKWGSVLGGLILLPFIVPEVVRALAWRVLLDPIFGALNYILVTRLPRHAAAASPGSGEPSTALPSVTMVNVWAGLPFFIILCTAGLKAVDAEQYDAAAVDGANAWRRFLHVTLPGMRYVIIVATLLSTILTFNNFGLTYLLTGGGPGGATRVYTILAYEYAITGLRYGSGTAVAMTTAPFLFLLIMFLGRYMMARTTLAQRRRRGGIVWRTAMAILWPVRMVLRGLLAVFWLVNDTVETDRRVGGAGGAPARRRHRCIESEDQPCASGNTILYVAARGGAALRADAVLLHLRDGLQEHAPDPAGPEHVLAHPLDAGALPLHALREAVPDLVQEHGHRGGRQHDDLGAGGGARRVRTGALEVARLGRLGTTVLIAYLMPPALLMIPLYYILVQLKLQNTLMALMVTYPSIILPFATWLMMGYYRSIPEELEDAAMIDGCSRFGAFFRVVLPLVRPALLAVTMFAITNAWNEFLYAFSFLRSSENFTLSVGLQGMIIGDVQPWGELMASCLMTALPVVIIYMLGQRFMVAGLTAGSVKG